MFVTSEMLKTIARPFDTLSSLLASTPQPGMRATASDAPGSMLYEVGGKWGGSLGSVSQATLDSLTAGELAMLADGVTTRPVTAPSFIGTTTRYVDLMLYGPPTDGVTPADVAFGKAVAASIASGKPVLLPPLTIVIKNGIRFNALIGTPGKSKIKLAPDYVQTGTAMFTNVNIDQQYNESTADSFSVYGVDFECTPYLAGGTSLFKLFNNKKIRIELCDFLVNPSIAGGCSFDFFSANKDVVVTQCRFINKSAAATGGMWIRTFGGGDGVTTSENIIISNCYFHQESGDEALAVSGVYGKTKNVLVTNNTFYAPASTVTNPYLVTISPGGDSVYPQGQLYNVRFTGNRIYTESTTVAALRIGRDGQDKIMRNVVSSDNQIEINYAGAENVQGIRFLPQLTATSLGEVVPVDQGLISERDQIISYGATKANGICALWGVLDGAPCSATAIRCRVSGNIRYGTTRMNVIGGEYSTVLDCHSNPLLLSGGRHRSSTASGAIFDGEAKRVRIDGGADIIGATYATIDTSSTTTLVRRYMNSFFGSTHASNSGVLQVNNRTTGTDSEISGCRFTGASQTSVVQGGHANIRFSKNWFNGAIETDENVLTVTADANAQKMTSLIKFSGSTIRTVTLDVPPYIDHVIAFERTDSNTTGHVISAGSGRTINGSASFTLSTAYQTGRIRAISATAWVIA